MAAAKKKTGARAPARSGASTSSARRAPAKKAAAAKAPARKSETGGNYFSSPKHKLQFIRTGCTNLDLALGGGWAMRRVINIVGDKATGKTLLAIEACANFMMQYPKGKIHYMEVESAFDEDYAGALGMPIESIDFGDPKKKPDTVSDMYRQLVDICSKSRPGAPTLVIVDSLDALTDEAEKKRDFDEGTYGGNKAKQLSEMFRRLIRLLEQKNVTLIIISQIRDKINAMFGRKVTRSGGRALDFYASQILYLAHTGQLTVSKRGKPRTIGVKITASVDKNKVGLAHRKCDFQIRYGYGIDDAQALVDYLNDASLLKEAGIKKDEVKNFLNYMLELEQVEHDEELANLRALVTKDWYAMERSLMPKRGKYATAA